MHRFLCYPPAAVQYHVTYLLLHFPRLLTQKTTLRMLAYHKHQVARLYLVLTFRDDRLRTATDGHYPVTVVTEVTRRKTLVQHRSTASHFHCA